MPVYSWECPQGHQREQYFVNWRAAEGVPMTCDCGLGMERIIVLSSPLLYFEEGRGRWIPNIANDPLWITSPAQHREAMKKYGVEQAGSRMGYPGCQV